MDSRPINKPPGFLINLDLLRELACQNREGGVSFDAEEAQKIQVVPGFSPNPGHYASFSSDDSRITLFPLAIFFEAMKEANSHEEVASLFERKLASSLAHEIRHWQIYQKYPRFAVFSKYLEVALERFLEWTSVICISILVSTTFWLYASLFHWALAMIFVAVVFGSSIQRIILRNSIFWNALIYRISWNERLARDFERWAEKDPRWLEVCKIEEEFLNSGSN